VTVSASLAELIARFTTLDPAAAALVSRLIALALTVAVLWLVYALVMGVIARLHRRGEAHADAARGARLRTIASLLANLARWVMAFVVVVVVLRELGVDVQALIVSAGIVGLAVAFGAQALIRDVITGFFLLVEGLIAVGDDVQVGAHSGTIETIGLRVTTLRLPDGAVHVLPNGQLTEFTNRSSGWARAVVDVTIARDVPVDRALDALRQAAEEWARATGTALDAPQTQGIIKVSGGDAVLRLTVKVPPGRRFDAEAELRRRIKDTFDRERLPLVGAS
jgi:small conductance mechanosensitive channel